MKLEDKSHHLLVNNEITSKETILWLSGIIRSFVIDNKSAESRTEDPVFPNNGEGMDYF